MDSSVFDWAQSKTAGQISEVSVLAPIKRGRVPGERRTYEERAQAIVDNFAERVSAGLPNELNLVPSIHFGRILILKPDQYLLGSDIPGVEYRHDRQQPQPGQVGRPYAVPKPFDEYHEHPATNTAVAAGKKNLKLRSFILTSVEFDGDLRVYFRDISTQLGTRFDSIFENCEDFPGTADFEAFWLWIRRFQIRTQLFYAACPDLSVARIKQLAAFKRNFDVFVARVRGPGLKPGRGLDALFDEFLKDNLQFNAGFPFPSGVFRGAEAESEI